MNKDIPLAERMRPTRLEHIVGQKHLLAKGKPLYQAILSKNIYSMLFWGPPGVGKTSLAKFIAGQIDAHYVGLSAVNAGVKDIRAAATEALKRQEAGERTLLFLDEVHRFNKSQQDILLPFVENGTLTLIAATTENPSFEVNSALLSRMQLYVLEALDDAAIEELIKRALQSENGFAGQLRLDDEALKIIIAWANGDARRALGALEIGSSLAEDNILSASLMKNALSVKTMAFDKSGEHFYNLISALHKSIRGCDANASLYWLARLLEGGAEPLYVARRLVRIASEDIGLADPNALRLAIAAKDAIHFLGMPEGELALAQACFYLAIAPKSNGIYTAYSRAKEDARAYSHANVPLHLRNAPTKMMKDLDYGKEYQYYFNNKTASFAQQYFPDNLQGRVYYQSQNEAWDKKVGLRLEELAKLKRESRG